MTNYLYVAKFLGNVSLIAAESLEEAKPLAHKNVLEIFGRENYDAFSIMVRPATNDDIDWAMDTNGFIPEGELQND